MASLTSKLHVSICLFSCIVAMALAGDYETAFLICASPLSSQQFPISEAIVGPKSPSFSNVLSFYVRNKRFALPSTPKPQLIVTVKHESHAQAAVLCAKKLGLQIRMRSGGHDYEGLSYVSSVPFIIVDMFNLRSIDINLKDQTAWVQSGALVGELYYKIANKSNLYAFPAGVCPSLGVGGHFTNGGYGVMMRKYGLAVDNVIDARIVDAKGRILDRKAMGEDLFWALRGGEGSSFGIILSWQIKLVSVPEKVTVFNVDRTVEKGATDLVWKWQTIAHKLDENLFLRLQLVTVNGTKPGTKTVQVSFIGMFLGEKPGLINLMDSAFPELGLESKDCISMRWIESTLFFYGMPNGTPLEFLLQRNPGPSFYLKHKSDYVKKPISKASLTYIFNVFTRVGELMMQWNPYGGKMAEIPETATAFPHRGSNIFKIQYLADWTKDGAAAESYYVNMIGKFFRAMTPFVSSNPREAFLNYRDIDVGSIGASGNGSFAQASVYGRKYFTVNFDRLVKVKTAVDPDNFFRFEQSIPVRG